MFLGNSILKLRNFLKYKCFLVSKYTEYYRDKEIKSDDWDELVGETDGYFDHNFMIKRL